MKELFIFERNDRGLQFPAVVALIAALAMLLVFAGCTPAKQAGVDKSKPWASVAFRIDKSVKYAPSIAVWVADDSGNTTMLFSTKKAADKSMIAQRPGMLPVRDGANKGASLDAVSSATPSGSEAALELQIPESFKGKKLTFYIEANASYDFNGYYKEGLKSGDTGYSDVNGQPSVVWTATADTAAHPSGEVEAAVAGHGDVLGASGNIDAGMANVTTAATLLSGIKITYGMDGSQP